MEDWGGWEFGLRVEGVWFWIQVWPSLDAARDLDHWGRAEPWLVGCLQEAADPIGEGQPVRRDQPGTRVRPGGHGSAVGRQSSS